MTTLAIDTATDILSVALEIDDGKAARRLSGTLDVGLKHTASLLRLIDRLMSDAEMEPHGIDLVACMRGPGSFTGLRIGMATAKGLAWGIALASGLDTPPVVSLPTLDMIARGVAASASALVIPVIDGRKQRFYGAAYIGGIKLTEDLDLPARDLLETAFAAAAPDGTTDTAPSVILTGPHADRFFEETGPHEPTITIDPGARDGRALALIEAARAAFAERGADALDEGPEYVRLSQAEESLLDRASAER